MVSSIKTELSDTFDVDDDIKHVRLTEKQLLQDDKNQHRESSGTNNTAFSLQDERFDSATLLSVGYVKEEPNLDYTLECNTLNSKGNEGFHWQNSIPTNSIKKEAWTTRTSEHQAVKGHGTINVKGMLQHVPIEEHDTDYIKNMSQQGKIDGSDVINMEMPTRSGHLKSNKVIKTNQKRYTCNVCGYIAIRSEHLKKHKLIHSGEKPYKCDVCDYSAKQYGNLKTHKRIHSGEKPFKCSLCDYRSTTSGSLKKHKLIHSGEKPYKCDLCDYRSTQTCNLKTHTLTHFKV